MEKWADQAELEVAEESFVFSWEPDGSIPWTPDSATRCFASLRTTLGLDDVRLHDLRHFAATRMMAAGVPVRTVSGRLGHAASVFGHIDEYYRDQRDEWDMGVATQLVRQLSEPRPKDSRSTTQLERYRELDVRWREWSSVVEACQAVAAKMGVE